MIKIEESFKADENESPRHTSQYSHQNSEIHQTKTAHTRANKLTCRKSDYAGCPFVLIDFKLNVLVLKKNILRFAIKASNNV